MHVYSHTYVPICLHTYIHTYIRTYLPTYAHVCSYIEALRMDEHEAFPSQDHCMGVWHRRRWWPPRKLGKTVCEDNFEYLCDHCASSAIPCGSPHLYSSPHIYIYIDTSLHICIYMSTYISASVYTYMSSFTCTSTKACIPDSISIYTYICVYVNGNLRDCVWLDGNMYVSIDKSRHVYFHCAPWTSHCICCRSRGFDSAALLPDAASPWLIPPAR